MNIGQRRNQLLSTATRVDPDQIVTADPDRYHNVARGWDVAVRRAMKKEHEHACELEP